MKKVKNAKKVKLFLEGELQPTAAGVEDVLLSFLSHLTSSCSSSSKNGGLEADGAKSGVPPEADFVALAAQVGGCRWKSFRITNLRF